MYAIFTFLRKTFCSMERKNYEKLVQFQQFLIKKAISSEEIEDCNEPCSKKRHIVNCNECVNLRIKMIKLENQVEQFKKTCSSQAAELTNLKRELKKINSKTTRPGISSAVSIFIDHGSISLSI